MTDDLDDLIAAGDKPDPPKTPQLTEPVRCPYCRGSGRNWGRKAVCWKCKGEGFIARGKRGRRKTK